MRIVLLNQFFWPDKVATSQLLTDLAHQLALKQKVLVICGGAAVARTLRFESDIPAEIIIVRTKTFAFGHSAFARIASYSSYLAGTLWQGIFVRQPDAFVTLTTPPLLSIVGSLLGSLHKTRHFIWEMDVYPDIAGDIGYIAKDGILARIAGIFLDWARKRATAIIVLGEDMKCRLIARGIPEEKIRVAENWADGKEIVPCPFQQGPLLVHYSGNLGFAHDTDTIKEVISRLRNRRDIRFVFAGGGPRRPALEDFCKDNNLNNVEFRPYCSRAELGSSLGEGHLGLVTQLPQTLGSIVPSKIYGIMASGRPLLYIGPSKSTPARHIEQYQCGWHIQPGDSQSLEELLIRLAENRERISLFGANARTAFEQNFNRAMGITRVLRVLEERPQAAQRNTSLAESVRGERP